MVAKTMKVTVRLPRELTEQLAVIANMAGVPLESVLKIALAMYALRHVPPPPNARGNRRKDRVAGFASG